MLTTTLCFLLPVVMAIAWGYPVLVGTDFIAYFTAATMVAQGQGSQLYQADAQWATQQVLFDAARIVPLGLIVYVNPPLLAAVVAVFYPFGMVLGGLLWVISTLVVAGAVLLWVARESHPRLGWVRSALLPLCFMPFLEALYFGQMAAIMLVAFGGWFALCRAGHPRLAGLVLSLTLLKPQYAPGMLLYLAWKRQWAQLIAFAAGGVVQGLATLLIILPGGEGPGLGALAPYFRFGGESNVVVHLQLNLRGLVWHLFPGADAIAQLGLLGIATALALIGFLAVIGRTWAPESTRFPWETLALFAFVPITTYHNNLLHLYLLLPPVVALFAAVAPDVRQKRSLSLLAALLALTSIGVIPGLVINPYFYLVVGWVVALGALALGLRNLRSVSPLVRTPAP